MIYLAAPFFCERELNVVKRVEALMEKHSLPYFSPRLGDNNDLPLEEKMKPENARKIFDMDIQHMLDAEMCLAFIDGSPFYNAEKGRQTFARDMGTAFEMGFFYAKGIPVLTYSATNQPTNLMLSQATHGHFRSLEALETALGEVMEESMSKAEFIVGLELPARLGKKSLLLQADE